MFNNLGIIRRYYVEKWTDRVKQKSKSEKDIKEKNEKEMKKEVEEQTQKIEEKVEKIDK